jgi:hypothetical protein
VPDRIYIGKLLSTVGNLTKQNKTECEFQFAFFLVLEDLTFRKRYIAPKDTTIPLHWKYVTYNEGILTTGHHPTSSVLHITHQSEGQSGISLL